MPPYGMKAIPCTDPSCSKQMFLTQDSDATEEDPKWYYRWPLGHRVSLEDVLRRPR
jgi:hypothetical protein